MTLKMNAMTVLLMSACASSVMAMEDPRSAAVTKMACSAPPQENKADARRTAQKQAFKAAQEHVAKNPQWATETTKPNRNSKISFTPEEIREYGNRVLAAYYASSDLLKTPGFVTKLLKQQSGVASKNEMPKPAVEPITAATAAAVSTTAATASKTEVDPTIEAANDAAVSTRVEEIISSLQTKRMPTKRAPGEADKSELQNYTTALGQLKKIRNDNESSLLPHYLTALDAKITDVNNKRVELVSGQFIPLQRKIKAIILGNKTRQTFVKAYTSQLDRLRGDAQTKK